MKIDSIRNTIIDLDFFFNNASDFLYALLKMKQLCYRIFLK